MGNLLTFAMLTQIGEYSQNLCSNFMYHIDRSSTEVGKACLQISVPEPRTLAVPRNYSYPRTST